MCLHKALHKLCVKTLLSVGLNIVGDDVLCALNREMGKFFFFGKLALITEDI